MPCLMCCYADRADRAASISRVGKTDHICTGIVMIGQLAGNMFDPNRMKPVRIKDTACRLFSGKAAAGIDLSILSESRTNIKLRPKSDQDRRNDQKQIIRIKIEIRQIYSPFPTKSPSVRRRPLRKASPGIRLEPSY